MPEKTENKEFPNLRCVGDRIIIKIKPTAYKELQLQLDNKDKVPLEHMYQGIVVMVGDGKVWDKDICIPPDCKPGDIVYLNKIIGEPLMFDFGAGMNNYLVIRECNVHLVDRKS